MFKKTYKRACYQSIWNTSKGCRFIAKSMIGEIIFYFLFYLIFCYIHSLRRRGISWRGKPARWNPGWPSYWSNTRRRWPNWNANSYWINIRNSGVGEALVWLVITQLIMCWIRLVMASGMSLPQVGLSMYLSVGLYYICLRLALFGSVLCNE